MPKRIGYLAESIYSMDNLELADRNARRGKKSRYGVIKHDKHKEENLIALHESLKNNTYKVSPYKLRTIREHSGKAIKTRTLKKLPYYPDRIMQWALMNKLVPIWDKLFISQTYSCIIGRGIHKCAKDVQKALIKDVKGTKYCLQMDIRKYYDSIDHDILYEILQKKIKDKLVLSWLKEIIYSTDGIPIGSFTSQYFANIYLTYFDHYCKETLHIKHYFRYADNIVILCTSKELLREWFNSIIGYLSSLKLTIKSDWQIYNIDIRGIDFVGYVFYHGYTKLRKSTKSRMLKLIHKFIREEIDTDSLRKRIASYLGWMKYCNSKHLLQYINKITCIDFSNWIGIRTTFRSVIKKSVRLVHIEFRKKKCLIQFIYNNRPWYIESKNFRKCAYLKKYENQSIILAV